MSVTWRGGTPAPGVPGQGFSVRWTGYVRAPETGVYVLHTEWDDATDIRFAGENVLEMEHNEMAMFADFESNKGFIPVESVQYFTAGQLYRIELTYKNVQGVSRAVLAWARPSDLGHPTKLAQTYAAAAGQRYRLIPQEFLYSDLPQAASVNALANATGGRSRLVVRRRAANAPAAPRSLAPAALLPPTASPTSLAALATLPRGTVVALTSLYFTRSTADLLPASRPTLNTLAQTLRRQPALRLEIVSHTDNMGEAGRNLRLSQQRAQLVRRYLMQQGIDSLRLTPGATVVTARWPTTGTRSSGLSIAAWKS